MSESFFAYGAGVVVSTDGAEILVYDARDEAPKWKATLDAPAADVAVGSGEVVAIDGKGAVSRFDAASGAAKGTAAANGAPRAIAVSESGAIAVALAKQVVVIDGDARTTLDVEGARALAWNGAHLAAGTDDGKVVVALADRVVATADAEDPVRAVARRPGGGWLATAGDRVVSIDDAGSVERVVQSKDAPPSTLACSPDGALVAAKVARNKVVVLALAGGETVASIVYPEREVARAAIADDGRFVWIGLAGGDANKIDLDSDDVYRTDPHEGRERRRWIVRAKIDKRARAKQKEKKTPPRAKAPRKPAAATTPAEAPVEAPKPTGPREPVLPPSPAAARNAVLAVLTVAVAVALATLKCG